MSKFKAGDKVKVISLQTKEERGDCDTQIGETGVIVEFTDNPKDTIPYLVDFGKEVNCWWFGETNLEIYLATRDDVLLEIEKTKLHLEELYELLDEF